jgi:hypothetical protein
MWLKSGEAAVRHTLLVLSIALLLCAACQDNSNPTQSQSPGEFTEIELQGWSIDRLRDSSFVYENLLDKALISANTNSGVDALLNDTSYDVYAVTTIWGSFDATTADVAPAITMDWSGSMTMTGCGVLGLINTISFEPDQDYLLPTLMLWTSIAWHSETSNDVDGLVCYVAVSHDCPLTVMPQLTIQTIPIALTYPAEKLADLNEYYPVSNTAGILVYSRKLTGHLCKRGVMQGSWVRGDASHSFGTFEGTWAIINTANTDPSLTGKLRGEFWAGDTLNSFTGEWYGPNDARPGTIAGEWIYTDPTDCALCGTQYGIFKGLIFAPNGDQIGVLEGEFGHLEIPSPNKLEFKGTFALRCDPRPWDWTKDPPAAGELPTDNEPIH